LHLTEGSSEKVNSKKYENLNVAILKEFYFLTWSVKNKFLFVRTKVCDTDWLQCIVNLNALSAVPSGINDNKNCTVQGSGATIRVMSRASVRPGWKFLAVANTLAYNTSALVTKEA